MSRRFAKVGRFQRSGGGGGGSGGGPVYTQTPPLPASSVEYWHSELGASAANAIGQIGGRTLPAVGAPTVAADGVFFKGKAVYQSNNTGPDYWAGVGLTDLIIATQRPWFFAIGRVRNYGAGVVPTLWSVGPQTGAGTYGFRHGGRGTSPNGYYEGFRNHNNTLINADSAAGTGTTSPHTWELTGADATLGLVSVVDAVQVAVTTNAVSQSAVGGTINSAAIGSPLIVTGQTSVAFFLVCSAVPSASEINALRGWALGYWGVP